MHFPSSISTGDATEVIKIIKECNEIAEAAKSSYHEAADALNIKAFQCIHAVANSDLDTEVKTDFADYLTVNKSNLQRSYVLGKWQRVNSTDTTKDVIVVKQQGNNFIGVYEVVGESSLEYQKKVGEIA